MPTRQAASKKKNDSTSRSNKKSAPKKTRAIKTVEGEDRSTADDVKVEVTPPATTTNPTKRLSALDAAVIVLQQSDVPMNTRQIIEAMAAGGYWTSPNGKTPHATLYSAILREINAKGDAARFVRKGPGEFAVKR